MKDSTATATSSGRANPARTAAAMGKLLGNAGTNVERAQGALAHAIVSDADDSQGVHDENFASVAQHTVATRKVDVLRF